MTYINHFRNLKSLCILFFLTISSGGIFAQNPRYEARLVNDSLVAPNVYEFDIFVKRIGDIPLETYGLQVALLFNDTVRGGGILSSFYIPESSEMSADQLPNNIDINTVIDGKRVFKLTGNIPSGPGTGTMLSNFGYGTKLGRFRIATTAPAFRTTTMDLNWNFDQENFSYATKFNAYVAGFPADITNQANHLNELQNRVLTWWASVEVPRYEAKIINDKRISPNEFEFDIYVKLLDTQKFEVFGLQVCLILDDTIRNGGTINAIYIPETSEMLPAQIPKDPNVATVFSGKRVFKIAGRIPSGPGTGTLISDKENGTRLGRFRVSTTAESFAPFAPNIQWNFDQMKYNYATKFYAYSENVIGEFRGRDITTKSNHLIEISNSSFE